MSATDRSPESASLRDRLRRIALVWTDAVVYAIALAVALTIGAMVVGISTGGGFVRGNILLFIAGWSVIAYATAKLWPRAPDELDEPTQEQYGPSLPATQTQTRFQSVVAALPPVRWMEGPHPAARISTAGKLFLGGCLTLLSSVILEVVFGVA